ncbi:ABC transporter substrate-binding protein [Mycolicibacterium sp. P1-5]|uniref:ABC transporter substrate-binding protein n=1 Tax=Mycolicibacterium sp. P1-5 TaxID=2024617 RepID=UPI0011EC9DC4|nr:ABC transporter substrate-binding protein [Mycolicibacterium sp. P1-5]KAA0100536.1 ABC transporter substrate-binding protein [Mycolicibacterium sp. P1-5]
MTSIRRSAAVAALATLAVTSAGVTACSSSDTSSNAHQLTVAYVVDPSWSHVPVAQKAGYFRSHGLDVKVVNFSTGVEALQALTAGQVDVATAAAVPTSAAVTKSPSLRIVADGARWNGARLVARRSAGIASLADLNNKTIGTPLGTSGAFFASTVVQHSGTDARLIQVAPSAVVTAATQHNVDAISIFQPYQTQVIQALGDDAVVLKDNSPESFVDHCLYLSTEATTNGKATDLSAFFAALRDAGKDLTAQKPEAIAAVADAVKLDSALISSVLKEYDFTLQLKPQLAEELTALGNWAKSNGKIDGNVKLPDYQSFVIGKFIGV